MSDGGKGDKRIPSQVSRQQVSDNWDLIWGKKVEPVIDDIMSENKSYEQYKVDKFVDNILPKRELPHPSVIRRISGHFDCRRIKYTWDMTPINVMDIPEFLELHGVEYAERFIGETVVKVYNKQTIYYLFYNPMNEDYSFAGFSKGKWNSWEGIFDEACRAFCLGSTGKDRYHINGE